MRPRVHVLCEGMIRRDGKTVLEAHSSSTLVDCGDLRIVVDTSSTQYRPKVLASLTSLRVDPADIDIVVNTHAHHDHRENDDLFTRARLVSNPSISLGEGEERPLAKNVRLVGTPGHTSDSISVFVESDRRYALVGDAIPIAGNYEKWVPPAANIDPEMALRSMRRIVDWAEVVVPGHGPAFEVRKAR